MNRHTPRIRIVTLMVGALVLTGCAPSPGGGEVSAPSSANPSPVPSETSPFEEGSYYAAEALLPAISVHDSPSGAVIQSFSHPQPSGAPLNFLVTGHDGEWLEVLLPSRPNGTSGWIAAQAVEVREMPYRLEVSLSENTMELYEKGRFARTFSVATGTGGTPTPVGTFYLTELLAPTNPGYGPYAYGVSAFSEVLNNFGGGPGQIGLHGTDDAGSIGTAASHGCIRLSNDDITELAGMLPLGTPIIVRA